MKTIPLTQGLVALVDDADFEAVNAFNWCADRRDRRWYASRKIKGTNKQQYLHRFLLPESPRVDHRDGDGLNNQRKNLRPATRSQNMQGFQRKPRGTSSIYRGVTWSTKRNKWVAQIGFDGKGHFLGHFNVEADAARARDIASLKFFGKDAGLNFPL